MIIKLLFAPFCVRLIAGAPVDAAVLATSETATVVPVTVTPNYCDDYTLFNNVCIQTKTTPAAFDVAEANCLSEGAHLMSIHNDEDNDGLLRLINASLPTAQSVFLGLQMADGFTGYYSHTDGSAVDYFNWAKYFPNVFLGRAVQLFLKDNELGGAGEWSNVWKNTETNYVCVRPNIAPAPACPNLMLFNHDFVSFSSPGYPEAMTSDTKCTYLMTAFPGQLIQVQFPEFDADSGTTVNLYDGLNAVSPMVNLSGYVSSDEKFTSTTNIMRLVYHSSKKARGKGWSAKIKWVM